MSVSEMCNKIFDNVISDYHITDHVDAKKITHSVRLPLWKTFFMISVGLIQFSGI